MHVKRCHREHYYTGGWCVCSVHWTESFVVHDSNDNVLLYVLCCSKCILKQFPLAFAFMLPISTPPNAIVFASGMLRMKSLILNGLLRAFVVVE
jgi:hypothetical protein